MRLFEADVRAACITASASSTRLSTQASNFSLLIRSGALSLTTTVSTPNCLKQSESVIRADSFMPIKATRADARFVAGIEAILDPRAEFMTVATYNPILARVSRFGKRIEGQCTGTKVSLWKCTDVCEFPLKS